MSFVKISKQAAVVAALMASLGSFSLQASAAATINSQFVVGENNIEDLDAERVLDADENAKTDGNFAEGDVIQTVLRFTDVNSTVISDNIPSPYQLWAYAELLVVDIVDPTDGIGECDTDLTGGFCTLIFAPTGNLSASNVFADIYERTSSAQSAPNITSQSAADAITNVKSLTKIASLGIVESDDFWVATTLLDIGEAAKAAKGSTQSANGVFGLSFVSNEGSIPFVKNGMESGTTGTFHDAVGSASAYVKATTTNADWLVESNTEVTFRVPEPSTLALLGLSMLGLGIAKRRRPV